MILGHIRRVALMEDEKEKNSLLRTDFLVG